MSTRRTCSGMTLIELVIGMSIIALLMMIAAPSFVTWVQNSQIRNAAEAIQNGLQLARTEAVRRNTLVRFQLSTDLTASCAIATPGDATIGGNWVISLDDPSNACTAALSDTLAPRIIQVRTAADGSPSAVVTAAQTLVIFNGIGQLTPIVAANIDIDVSNPAGGDCATATTDGMRCLRVRVSPGGQVRMCNPVLASTDPQGC